jgi:hypothetical protein
MLRTTATITGYQGAPYWNQLHFGGDTAGEAVAAADAAESLWQQLANFLATPGSVLVSSDVEQIDPATGQIVNVFPASTAAINFVAAGDILPYSTQGLIRLRTGDFVNGRELRGRIFIPGWVETASTAGNPTAPAVGAMNAAAASLLSAGAGAGGLGVYSPTHRVFSLVSVAQTWTQWAVLRSRRD